jgi:hypothetical protein
VVRSRAPPVRASAHQGDALLQVSQAGDDRPVVAAGPHLPRELVDLGGPAGQVALQPALLGLQLGRFFRALTENDDRTPGPGG